MTGVKTIVCLPWDGASLAIAVSLRYPRPYQGDTPLVCPSCGNLDTAPEGWWNLPECSAECGATMVVDVSRRLVASTAVEVHGIVDVTPQQAMAIWTRHLGDVETGSDLITRINSLPLKELVALSAATKVMLKMGDYAVALAEVVMRAKFGLAPSGRQWGGK